MLLGIEDQIADDRIEPFRLEIRRESTQSRVHVLALKVFAEQEASFFPDHNVMKYPRNRIAPHRNGTTGSRRQITQVIVQISQNLGQGGR